MSTFKDTKWLLLVIAALGTLVFLMLVDVVFVTYYVFLMNPGLEQEFYNDFAYETAAPFVFCFAPFPVFLTARWIGRKAGRAFYTHSILYIVFYIVIDLSIIVGSDAISKAEEPIFLIFGLNIGVMMLAALFAAYQLSKEYAREKDDE